MKFVKGEDLAWQEKQGYSKKIFLTWEEIGFSWALVQMLNVKAWETAESHYHKKQTEMFYFLEDHSAYWVVNGEKIEPKKWSLLVIEPNDKHIVVNNTDRDYVYLVFKVNYESSDLIWD